MLVIFSTSTLHGNSAVNHERSLTRSFKAHKPSQATRLADWMEGGTTSTQDARYSKHNQLEGSRKKPPTSRVSNVFVVASK
mmetsp:Transcript_11391/g.16711  ORF Transcript_11391/g.16711 Transcript_11391/m.16711 type:complete len:81 (+) Transcript_11391:973-1215(+)